MLISRRKLLLDLQKYEYDHEAAKLSYNRGLPISKSSAQQDENRIFAQ